MDKQKLTDYLEILCQSGCASVNATIVAMEKKQSTSVTKNLTEQECAVILRELKAIMSVYEH